MAASQTATQAEGSDWPTELSYAEDQPLHAWLGAEGGKRGRRKEWNGR